MVHSPNRVRGNSAPAAASIHGRASVSVGVGEKTVWLRDRPRPHPPHSTNPMVLSTTCMICLESPNPDPNSLSSDTAEDPTDPANRLPLGMHLCVACEAPTCARCFRLWVNSRIRAGAAHALTCPACPHPLTDDDVRRWCSRTVYIRCRFLRTRHLHKHDPGAVWCPNEQCRLLLPYAFHLSRLAQQDGGNHDQHAAAKIAECPECYTDICLNCFQTAHPSHIPCAGSGSFQRGSLAPRKTSVFHPRVRTVRSLRHSVAQWVWTVAHTKKCPCCHVRIQRAGGCAHMYCTLCGTRFCWICLGALPSPQSARPHVFPHAYHPYVPNHAYAHMYAHAHSIGLATPVRMSMGANLNAGQPTSRRYYFDEGPHSRSFTRTSTIYSTTRDVRQRQSDAAFTTRAEPVADTNSDAKAQKSPRLCVCPRVRNAASAVAMSAAAVAAVPVAAATAVVAAPPAAALYAVLPRHQKRAVRDHISSFIARF